MSCVESRKISIRAARDPNQSCGFAFSMSEKGAKVDGGKLVSKKNNSHKHSDYHEFVFELQNEPGSDLKFLDHPFDVMWVRPYNPGDKSCPAERGSDMDFNIGSIAPHKLVVQNANSRPCELQFALRFTGTDANGKDVVVAYDPVWSNGNGGSRNN